MDNLTHSLVGAALAEAGPRDRIALAAPTLILAANVPDVDVVSYFVAGEYAALAWRRGITHGVPALLLWPFIVAFVMLGWDRFVRRRRDPTLERARFRGLLALAALGAITHPALDWLNTYGMRWWLPFDGSWSYGDAVFIIDPWLWLLLGLPVFIGRSHSTRAPIAWTIAAVLTTALVIGTSMVPLATKVVWIAGIAALIVTRLRVPAAAAMRRRIARAAVATAAAYVIAMVAVAAAAERGALAAARNAGLQPVDIMSGPQPGSIAGRDVVVRTASAYHHGSWHWTRSPRLVIGPDSVPLRRGPAAVIASALGDQRVSHFLTWSRYPYMHAVKSDDGWRVRVGDARYTGRGLGGLEVQVTD